MSHSDLEACLLTLLHSALKPTPLCAGHQAQPHCEPDHAAGVVLCLRQGSLLGTQAGSSFSACQPQGLTLVTERRPGEEHGLVHGRRTSDNEQKGNRIKKQMKLHDMTSRAAWCFQEMNDPYVVGSPCKGCHYVSVLPAKAVTH